MAEERVVVRCAVAMALAVLGLAPARADAFELKHTSSGTNLRWQESQITFVIDPTVEAAVPGGADAVARAVEAWSGSSGAPALVTVAGPGGAKVAVDGHNSVILAPEGSSWTGDALAVTIVSLDEATGAILDTDVVINGRYPFAVLAGDAKGTGGVAVATDGASTRDPGDTPFDLEHVVAHEIGHALGLADQPDDNGALMYAYTLPGDASSRAPSSDDLDGLQVSYGGSIRRAGCGHSSVAASRPGGSDVLALAGMVAAAGAWLASHRRAWRVVSALRSARLDRRRP